MKDTRTTLYRLSASLLPPLVALLLSGCATPSDQSSNDNNALLWTLGGALFGARATQVGSVPGVAVGNAAQNYGLAQAGRSQVTVNNTSSPPPTPIYQPPTGFAVGDTKYATDKPLGGGATYTGPITLCDDGIWHPHGLGQLTYPNSAKYVGEFKNGKRNGQGTYTWRDGTWVVGAKYVGEFKNDEANGQGTCTWSDGRKYVGEWKDDERNGQGTQTWPSGQKYEGEWCDGKYNGKGKLALSNGTVQEGEWRNGQLINETQRNAPLRTEPHSELLKDMEYRDGKWQPKQ